MTAKVPSGADRPLRADARRNRERLLAQARIVFAEAGAEASLDEIARRSGVASGTLYRHFSTRLELIQAVLNEQMAELAELGQRLGSADDPFEGLSTWLGAILRHGLTYRGLSAAIMNSALDRGTESVARWHADLFKIGDALLVRARTSGSVGDARIEDVLKLVSGIAWSVRDADDGAGEADRMLALVLNGLRLRQ